MAKASDTPMVRKENWEDIVGTDPRGTFGWRFDGNTTSHLVFMCLGGHIIVLPIAGAPNSRGWEWDGDVEAPTLTPSIQCRGMCTWHGYIRAGALITI